MLKHCLACTALVALIASCNDAELAVPDRLVNTYARVVQLRNGIADTAQAQAAVRKTLADSGYTVEGFERELRSYGTDPKRMRALFDSVSKKLVE